MASLATDRIPRDEHQLFEVELEGWGRVRATKRVLASFQHQLHSEPGRNRTVKSCAAQLESAAAVHGPVRVETASMGRERRMPSGLYEGTVEVRITYSRGNLHEIRQATMACTTRLNGTLVDVKVVPPLNDPAKN